MQKKKKKNQASLTAMHDNIRIYHLGHNLGLLGPNLDHKNFEVSALLDVRHCPKLQSYAISRETNDANLRKWEKIQILGPILPLSPPPKKIFLPPLVR